MSYQIFISYRREGGDMLAQLLYDRLTQMGYSVFYDVESLRSGKFNEALYNYMDECNEALVVLSPNALDRCSSPEDWVRKEISYLIEKKKNIIPIMMKGFVFPSKLPDGMRDLDKYNGIVVQEMGSFPWVMEQLVNKFLVSISEEEPKHHNKRTKQNIVSDIFLREITLESIIESRQLEFEKSTIAQKIRAKRIQRFLELSRNASGRNSYEQKEIKNEQHQKSDRDAKEKTLISLRPLEGKYDIDEMVVSRSKHFSIVDPPDIKTSVYEVCVVVDKENAIKFYELERVLESENLLNNNFTQRTFYIENTKDEGNQLLIISSSAKAEFVIINQGLLIGNEVRITKHLKSPVFELFPESKSAFGLLDNNKFENDGFNSSQLSETNEIWVTSSVSNNVQMVFDIEPFEPILRKVYFSEDKKELMAKAKIKRGHKYFVFNIGVSDSTGNFSSTKELSNIEKGKLYKLGICGFPKDLEKAAKCFENDESEEALFNIAKLFLEDEICDEKLYRNYLIQSAELEFPQAMFDLANSYITIEEQPIEHVTLIEKAAKKGLSSAQFVLGYYYEKGIFYDKDLDSSFEWYLKSAQNDYKPAKVRLGDRELENLGKRDREDIAHLEKYLYVSCQENDGMAEFCLGGIFIYGLMAETNEQRGLVLLKKSVEFGCLDAAYELYLIYDNKRSMLFDKRKALNSLRNIGRCDMTLYKKLGIWLLKGIGCEQNQDNYEDALEILSMFVEKNDPEVVCQLFLYHNNSNNKCSNGETACFWSRKLLDLDHEEIIAFTNRLIDVEGEERKYDSAFEILKCLEKTGYPVGLNNLGWMYMNGFGCTQDYQYAKRLFEEAANLGVAASFWHLGEIYENGLGTDIDMDKAVLFYEKGAKFGNRKAIKRIGELGVGL